MKYEIRPEFFERVPNFHRGVIVVSDADNTARAPLLEEALRARIAEVDADESLAPTLPQVEAWYRVYSTFPSPRGQKIRPSIATMLRRIRRGGGDRIPFISPLVAISNLVSLTHLIPSGLIDADLVEGDLVVGYAEGSESFVPYGSEKPVPIEPGEAIYYDSQARAVLCRGLNSQGSRLTGIQASTNRAVIDVDTLIGVVDDGTAQIAAEQAADLVRDHCRGRAQVFFLSREHPSIEFQF